MELYTGTLLNSNIHILTYTGLLSVNVVLIFSIAVKSPCQIFFCAA